jgi:hypothetical protein
MRNTLSHVPCSACVRLASGIRSAPVRVILIEAFDAEVLVDGNFQDILNTLSEKAPRSRLEPYGGLIDELRRRGRSYREIAHILAEKCHVETAASTIHDFVRVRSPKKRGTKHQAPAKPRTGLGRSEPQVSRAKLASENLSTVSEAHQRIAALKARATPPGAKPQQFRYDPDQPLSLPPKARKP